MTTFRTWHQARPSPPPLRPHSCTPPCASAVGPAAFVTDPGGLLLGPASSGPHGLLEPLSTPSRVLPSSGQCWVTFLPPLLLPCLQVEVLWLQAGVGVDSQGRHGSPILAGGAPPSHPHPQAQPLSLARRNPECSQPPFLQQLLPLSGAGAVSLLAGGHPRAVSATEHPGPQGGGRACTAARQRRPRLNFAGAVPLRQCFFVMLRRGRASRPGAPKPQPSAPLAPLAQWALVGAAFDPREGEGPGGPLLPLCPLAPAHAWLRHVAGGGGSCLLLRHLAHAPAPP